MYIVFDDTGGNMSKNWGGHSGGETLLFEQGTKTQKKASTNDKHFTTWRLILLNGLTLIWVLMMI